MARKDVRTIAILCAGCRTLLYKYRKGGRGGLVKCLESRIVDDRERSSSTSGTVETRARNFFEKWERNGDIARDVDAAASARHRRERVTRGDVADILARAFAGERAGRRRVRITTVVRAGRAGDETVGYAFARGSRRATPPRSSTPSLLACQTDD